MQGKPPPEVNRPLTKCKIRTSRLTLFALAFSSLLGQASACDYGYYSSGGVCYVCPAGKLDRVFATSFPQFINLITYR